MKINSGKEDRSGVGIGLSNAKILCEAMGGSISLKSVAAQGTIVNFSVDVQTGDKLDSTQFSDPNDFGFDNEFRSAADSENKDFIRFDKVAMSCQSQ